MKTQLLIQVIFVCLIAGHGTAEAQTVTNTVETQYIHDNGSPEGKSAIITSWRRGNADVKIIAGRTDPSDE